MCIRDLPQFYVNALMLLSIWGHAMPRISHLHNVQPKTHVVFSAHALNRRAFAQLAGEERTRRLLCTKQRVKQINKISEMQRDLALVHFQVLWGGGLVGLEQEVLEDHLLNVHNSTLPRDHFHVNHPWSSVLSI